MVFKNLFYIILLPVILALVFFAKKKTTQASFRFSNIDLIKIFSPTLKVKLRKMLFYIKLAAIAFVVIALARPQNPIKTVNSESKGIAIVIAIDVSASMLAEDFNIENNRVNRLEVTKMVVEDFIDKRDNDSIGLVFFSAHGYTASPVTVDYEWVRQTLEKMEINLEEDSTSIGYAIATSLNRLRETRAKSKIIILVTDGRNNSGDISPQAAAELARALDVKIYTIGVGSLGTVPYPFADSHGKKVYKNIKIELDEDALKTIARKTNGKYFRAASTENLKDVYDEINKLEVSDIKDEKLIEYEDVFYKFVVLALVLMLMEIILNNTILRKIP